MFRLIHMPKSYILKLSDTQKKELNRFMKSTRDKEEYRRASAIKQKMEGDIQNNCQKPWCQLP